MSRGLQIGRRIPLGEESVILPLSPIQDVPMISLEQEAFAETLGNVERASEGALPQITTESFLTQEEAAFVPEIPQPELDFATQQIIAQGQQRRAQEAFAQTPRLVPTVGPIQTATISSPVVGTTTVFIGGGVRLNIVERRNAAIKQAAGKAVNKPSDEELSVPFQNERQFRRMAARSNIDATNSAFNEAIASGIPIQDISKVLADPNTKIGRKFQQARSDIEVLAIEASGLNDLALEARELSRSLDISLSKEAEQEINDILRGADDVLAGLGKGDVGERVAKIKTQVSILAVLNAIKPNLTASITTDEIRKARVEGISFAEFATRKAREFLTEESAEAAIGLSGQEDVINEFGRDKFKNQLITLFEKELREQWRGIGAPTQIFVDTTGKTIDPAPKFISTITTELGEASKQTDTGVSPGAVIVNSKGDIFTSGGRGSRSRVGDSEKFVIHTNSEALNTALIEFHEKELGITSGGKGLAGTKQSFSKEAMRDAGINLRRSVTDDDEKRMNKLDSSIKAQGGINKADIEDVVESSIRQVGSADLGNGLMAVGINRHKSDADGNAIRGFNFTTHDGFTGIPIPTKTWEAEIEGTGWLGFFQDRDRIAIGDEKVFLQDVMFLTNKDQNKWIIADKGGRILTVDGESLNFGTGAIEKLFRGELTRINAGLSLKGAEVIGTSIKKTEAARTQFGLEAETETVSEVIPILIRTSGEFNSLPKGTRYLWENAKGEIETRTKGGE